MNTIPTQCPNCQAVLQAPPEFAGQIVTCSECASQLQVPVAPAAPQSSATGQLGIDTGAEAQTPAAPAGAPAFERRRRKQSIDPKFIAIGIGVVLVIGGLWYFLSGSGPGKAMNYMPDDVAIIGVVHYDEMMDSKFTKTAVKEVAQLKGMSAGFEKEMGDIAEKIKKVTFGVSADGKDEMAFIEFKSSVTSKEVRSEINSRTKFKSKTVGKYKMYVENEGKGNDGFCLLDSRTMLIGKVSVMEDILNRNGTPKLAKGMSSALESADMSKTICMATTLKPKGASSRIPMGIPGVPGVPSAAKSADAIVVEADFGSSLKFELTVVCDESDDAKDFEKEAKDGLEKAEGLLQTLLGKAGEEFVEGINVSRSGSTVTLSGSVDTDLVKKFGEASKKGMRF